MCGRFKLTTPGEMIAEIFELAAAPQLHPRFNIAPTQPVAVVRHDETGSRRLDLMRWGLVPFWAEDPAIGNRMINARAETVAVKPAFREAFRHRRCLVPADGFYEWQRVSKVKQPYLVRMADDRPFAMAGLWESWRDQQQADTELLTCTILTTDANELMEPIHARMPVILDRGEWATWLDTTVIRQDDLRSLLVPFRAEAMRALAVSTHVNNPCNDDERCTEPA